MAILRNVELWFARLDPKHPNSKYNKEQPTWELQIRTDSKADKEIWEKEAINVKLLVGKKGTENEGEPILKDGKKQWYATLRKKSVKRDGSKSDPVNVDGVGGIKINPNEIGNGSIGHVRTFAREYNLDGQDKVAHILMDVKVSKLIVYKYKGSSRENIDDIEGETMEIINPSEAPIDNDDF